MTRGFALPALLAAALVLGAIGAAVAAGEAAPRGDAAADARRDELDMLERARAEQASRAAAKDVDPAETIRLQAIDAEVRRRLEEADREAELDTLSARIRARAASGPAGLEPAPGAAPGSPDDRDQTAVQATELVASGRATVLLVMRPGRGGIRTLNPTADPILCVADVCWVSRGPDRDARMIARRKALGLINTLGERAGACNDSTGCVFRNVEITGATSLVQPVDLRLLRHDRREPHEIRIDPSCGVEGGRLSCRGEAVGVDYRMWAVPEDVARQAGAPALLSAVGATQRAAARGLPLR